MTDIRPGNNVQAAFFNGKNEAMLGKLLYQDFQRRTGGDLSEKQKERLVKTVKHYMTEVYAKHPTEPIQYLNKEVLTSVVPDYMSYLRRNAGPTVAEDENGGGANGPDLRMDVGTRFSQLQAERQDKQAAAPVAPDFRIPLDEGPSPLSRFEEIRKQREAEVQREAEAAAALAARNGGAPPAPPPDMTILASRENPLNRFVDSDIDFRNSSDAAKARDQLALVMREAERQVSNAQGPLYAPMPQSLPDARRTLMTEQAPPIPLLPRQQGIATGNPTLALPDIIRDRPVLPQDVLKPQDDIVSYKENEYNLFVYSADRDWLNNNAENRYNFSVTFDPANNRSGFNFSPSTNIKFKNITRIEFVKAILPVEACDTLLTSSGNTGYRAPTLSTSLNMNIFSFPYLQVRIPELNTNGYGTNDGINNAFAAISYEAYWTADSSAANRGYTRMIPKFLKCQKVFYPTPLATLQKLTFEIQRPDGNLVCESKDTLDISGVFTSVNDLSGSWAGLVGFGANTNTNYVDSSGEFLFINTKTFFNRWAVTQGDRIQLKGLDFSSAFKGTAGALATQDLINFVTRSEGHVVCDVGRVTYNSGTSKWVVNQGPSSLGYANLIVIRSNFGKRSNESPYLMPFGGTAASDITFQVALRNAPAATAGRLINLNHQVQIILRVITRDMDAATKLRPDNLQA